MNFLTCIFSRALRDSLLVNSKPSTMPAPPVIEVDDLRTYFHTEEGVVNAVDDVSFRIEQGRTLGIVGESGSGKSVTSLSIMRLLVVDRPDRIGPDRAARAATSCGCPSAQMQSIRGRDISMIFQEPMTSLNPVFTVGAQIMEAIMLHQRGDQSRGPQADDRAASTKSASPIRSSASIPTRTRCRAARSSG